jgi:glycosyltransferase involved in cell wall biosynthesis
MRLSNVLYTGAFKMPKIDAASIRVLGVAQLFKNQNFKVSFAGWEDSGNKGESYEYMGYTCFPQSEFKSEESFFSRFIKKIFMGYKTFKWIKSNNNYSIIVLYNPPAFFSVLMLIWCRTHKIQLILDSTEWYESSHIIRWSGGMLSVFSYLAVLENYCRMRLIYPRFNNIIAISHYLSNYYKGRNVIRLPPIHVDSCLINNNKDTPSDWSIGDGVNFIYAGSAGMKDDLLPFIISLPNISRAIDKKVILHIVGMTKIEVDLLISDAGYSPESLVEFYVAHGWIPHSEVASVYNKSHFSILFRDDKRYAKAGFPTKLMESWVSGCPVFANNVGDLSLIGNPGVDVFFINRSNVGEQVSNAIIGIIKNNSYKKIKGLCIDKAEYYFNWKTYAHVFAEFVDGL